MATLQQLATESSMRHWTLTGPNAVVKVLSLELANGPQAPDQARGYITQAKFLDGLTSLQIERDLGLRPQSLLRGAVVRYLARLPRFEEVEYRYSAAMPDGQVWTDEMHAAHDDARLRYRTSNDTVVQSYPPGAVEVLQWRLTAPVPFGLLRHTVTSVIPFRA